MYEVVFYKDKNGKEPIKDYIYELSQKQTSKDARIIEKDHRIYRSIESVWRKRR